MRYMNLTAEQYFSAMYITPKSKHLNIHQEFSLKYDMNQGSGMMTDIEDGILTPNTVALHGSSYTPLMYFAFHGEAEYLEECVEEFCGNLMQSSTQGLLPFHYAIFSDSYDHFRDVIEIYDDNDLLQEALAHNTNIGMNAFEISESTHKISPDMKDAVWHIYQECHPPPYYRS